MPDPSPQAPLKLNYARPSAPRGLDDVQVRRLRVTLRVVVVAACAIIPMLLVGDDGNDRGAAPIAGGCGLLLGAFVPVDRFVLPTRNRNE